jgi:hypothetical protein
MRHKIIELLLGLILMYTLTLALWVTFRVVAGM